MKLQDKLQKRLSLLSENASVSWMDPYSPEYDRQVAEDALYHTIGPLAEHPRWTDKWTGPGTPVPGFTPGGPAPKWTEEQIVYAYAGNPNMLFRGGRDDPRSPHHGRMGGAPLLRMARTVARIYARSGDVPFITDLYSNGFIELVRKMKKGQDKQMSAFIPWVYRSVLTTMAHGPGGEIRTMAAAGLENELGHRGLRSLLDEINPEKIREAAQVVKGKYRHESSHDHDEDNPFGMFSASYYQVAMDYANALESNDAERIEEARKQITDLMDKIHSYNTKVGGASTGLGQAIDTPDRKTSIPISSIDAPTGDDDSTMAGNLPGRTNFGKFVDPETIKYVFDIAINHDLGKILATSQKYTAMAAELGAKGGKIGGPMTAQELRCFARALGRIGKHYPGKGRPRENVNIPRDAKGWWQPGEDPELEPLPVKSEAKEPVKNGLWHSIWSRNKHEQMGPTAIAEEFTREIHEFNHYGIKTARAIKTKTKNGIVFEEAVSKNAIAAALKSAQIKMTIIIDIHAADIGADIDECLKREGIIIEDLDYIDRSIIVETAQYMLTSINRALVLDDAPPGWKGSVKAMKKHTSTFSTKKGSKKLNPFAIAWSMHKKGAKPHYKEEIIKMRAVDTID